jgi:hypothetical protein
VSQRRGRKRGPRAEQSRDTEGLHSRLRKPDCDVADRFGRDCRRESRAGKTRFSRKVTLSDLRPCEHCRP